MAASPASTTLQQGLNWIQHRAAEAFETETGRRAENALTGLALRSLFRLVDLRLRLDPGFRRLIYRTADEGTPDDWRARIVLRARDGAFEIHADFGGGRVRCRNGGLAKPDCVLDFRNAAAARALLTKDPAQVLDMLLTGDLVFVGNMSHVARLSYLLTAMKERSGQDGVAARHDGKLGPARHSAPMARCDEVQFLDDPGMSTMSLDDFPRLHGFLEDYFAVTPAVCTERPRLYTRFFREEGLDPMEEGPVAPVLRQARAFQYLMAHRRPIVRRGDLLAGTTTSKEIGVVVYPECGGIPIWPELRTVNRRALNPYRIDPEDERILNEDVFPFWADRNVREVARAKHGNPRSIQLDERFVLYFQWKTQAVSHTIPGFPVVLEKGLAAVREEAMALARRNTNGGDPVLAARKAFYDAVAATLDGVMTYAAHLSREAARLAANERDPERRAELLELARICAKVPAGPAETLHEAIQAMWIVWVACHMENTNAGLSVGRIDQWLQPYFLADMAKLPAEDAARQAYVRRAVELVGCFYMRLTDHLPQVADLGNKLFGGSASGQVITLGGVTPEGANGVNDMTYICLKVTEMLGLKDPNINARYHEGVNSPEYLRRLCEVNLLTGATPSLHNDQAVIAVLEDQGMSPDEARDWSATGCVEPTSCGRHYGHTNCMMFNLVAPLEMALRDGVHPLLGEQVGPHTGDPRAYETFDEFLGAYFVQLRHMIELATEANNLLGEAHQIVRPTPFLSSLFQGPMEQGRDLSVGGARYNSSGTGNVGLVDVVDSLAAVKTLLYDERRVTWDELLQALEADFEGHDALRARLENRVPRFGTGHPVALDIANRVVAFCHEVFRAQPHYRGGHYNSGFWSMSNHVAFGMLSGALPSGRRKGMPFTPGLTPAPGRKASIVQHMHDVAGLDTHAMPNNIAFNVKVVPAPGDSQADAVGHMAGYAGAFMQEGGMQMQFNVVSSETLRDAMAHPENYRTLMVRISGYNAYFNDLNDDMKRELISRAEHRLG